MPTSSGSTAGGSESAVPLITRIVRVKLAELRTLTGEENAHFLSGDKYRQLVENLRADQVLTSAPLVHEGVVLSGNHRVKAAIEAGILEADVIEVVGDLPTGRRIAIQLAHNAINGEDDVSVLKRLYDGLDLFWKRYTALTDNMLGTLPKIDIKSLALGTQAWQELRVLFLPDQLEELGAHRRRIEDAMAAILKRSKEDRFAWVARLEDFDRVFTALVKVKEQRQIHNTALALRVMAELAVERLDQLQAGTEADHGT